jgi:hypothetical protein
LNDRASEDWSTSLGRLLEGLSRELESVGPDHEEPHDAVHARLDSIEQRLGEVRDRIAAKEGHPV